MRHASTACTTSADVAPGHDAGRREKLLQAR